LASLVRSFVGVLPESGGRENGNGILATQVAGGEFSPLFYILALDSRGGSQGLSAALSEFLNTIAALISGHCVRGDSGASQGI